MTDHLTTHNRVLAAIRSELWAITEDKLGAIVAIAQRLNDAPEAVAAQLGRPLQNTQTVSVRDGVALVPFNGPIFRYANLFTQVSGATSLEIAALDFNAAVQNPDIKAIVLHNGSAPGGMAAGIAEFAQQVRAASAIKPVVAYVEDLAASANYWISSAASEIVIGKTARLGSIGAVRGARKGADANVIEFVSSQSPKKRLDPSSPEGQASIQAEVDALGQIFVEDVAAYRNVSVEKVLSDFGQGDILVGQAAVSAGLADRLGSLESVIAELSGKSSTRRSHFMPTQSPAAEQPQRLTLAALKADHPSIYQAAFDEGKATGLTAGATTERERIQAVEAQSLPGHEALIASLKFDGKTTGAEAAVQVLNAERGLREKQLAALKADLPGPVPHATAPDGEPPAAQQSQGAAGFEKPGEFGVDRQRLELHNKALAYQQQHGGDYAQAIAAVSK